MIKWLNNNEFIIKMIESFPTYSLLVDRISRIRDESLTSFSPLITELVHPNTPSTRCNKHRSQHCSPHHDESLCSAAVLNMMAVVIQTLSMISNLERNTEHSQEMNRNENTITLICLQSIVYPYRYRYRKKFVPLLFENTCS